ncbi:MAG TPA: glycosyl hydrolase-related protein, partial [Terriglobales bacterium]|nr:glycosyl hydrolase-related protein [Terriglobales bacterium]
MKRRDVVKGLTLAAGGSLLPNSAWSLFAQAQSAPAASFEAVPIRGLVKRNGLLMQPIRITLQRSGGSASVVTKLNDVEADRRTVPAGPSTFQVFSEPVAAPQEVKVTVSAGDTTSSATVTLLPVRKALIYMLPHSHHDLGYTDIQSHIEEKQMHNISLAIDLARKTANYPEGARFIWNLEVLWSVDLFMQRKSKAERDEFLDAVKKGWLHINGMYANELTGLCRPEELLQLFRYSKVLGDQCGVPVNSAMMSDVPGYTWGTITAMSQAGIRYFSAAPNNGDRIGMLRIARHDRPFWAVSPSGKEKVLVWMPGHGYSSWGRADEGMVADCQDYLDSVKSPYDVSYIRWSGHGDNASPDPQICEFVRDWNQEYEWPRLAIASTTEAFAAMEERHGKELPQVKGDLTPYWEDGAGSSALETAMNRNSADRLTQAAAVAAMLPPKAYRAKDFTDAWRNVLLYSEHTWGASSSVSAPQSPAVIEQWERKRKFAVDADQQSKDLLAVALRAFGTGNDASAIDVVNATSWTRAELVVLPKELSASGDHVKDSRGKPCASQRLSTGELAFLASDVPPFGSARYHLSSEKPHVPVRRVTLRENLLDNGIVRARVDAETGNVVEFALKGKSGNLVDTECGEAVNEYLFVEGQDFAEIWKMQNDAKVLHYAGVPLDGPDVGSIQKSGRARITIEEDGPLVASLRIESAAPGCNSLVRKVRLIAEADWIELSNVVDKKRAPLPPPMDDRQEMRAWSLYGGKESVHFAFPFAIPDGKMHMDIPLAEMQPEIDQVAGANKNWLPVGRWVDVANDHHGVTWVSLDAPLVEVGEISATLAGAQYNPLLWRQHIAPTQKLYSWVMNNHWETNYRAYQEGVVEFRYALRAHSGYDAAAASRLAIGLSQPLVAVRASDGPVLPPVVKIEPADVLALALKPSEDGDAWIVRLFGASGEDRTAKLRWQQSTPPRQWLSDLSEAPLRPLGQEIAISG